MVRARTIIEGIKRHTLAILFVGFMLVGLAILKSSNDLNQAVKENAQIVQEAAEQTCENRAAARETVRVIVFGVLDMMEKHYADHDDTLLGNISELRLYMEEYYPPIDCEAELADD